MKKYIRKILKSLLVVLCLCGLLSLSVNIIMSYEAIKQNKNLSFMQVFIKNFKEGNDVIGITNYYKYGTFNDFIQTNKKIKMKDEFYKNPSRSIESKVNSFLNSYNTQSDINKNNNNNEIKIVNPKVKSFNNIEDSLYGFNELRRFIGLNAVEENKFLNVASDAHAVYLVNNRTIGHEEDKNKENYYSKYFYNRINKANYDTTNLKYYGEVLSIYPREMREGYGYLMLNLFNDIYHRFIMIDPDMSNVGFSERSGNNFTAMVMDSTINENKTNLLGVVYPFNGQEDVFTYFAHKYEIPDPMPESKGLVGFAISFSVGSKHKININKFSLKEKKTDKNIEGKSLMPDSEEQVGDNNFAFIPYQQLKHKTIYVAHIEGCADDSTKIDYEWSFTTL